jgi:tetratricopeptide (TPR) repeat protein
MSKKNKHFKLAFVYLIVTAFLFLFIQPSTQYKIGDIFFGRVPKLYNVTLAQFFFYQAANPWYGKPAPYANHQLSRTFFIKGVLEESLAVAKKELEVYPEHRATYYIIGLTLGYMNHEEEAIDAFTKYIEYNPSTWAGRNDKAWLQFRIGDIDGALATLEPVAKTFTYTPWVQNTYCALLIAKKKYTEALESCTNAKNAVDKMTEKDWGHAYPGNDPRIYSTGLDAMKTSVAQNLDLIKKNTTK